MGQRNRTNGAASCAGSEFRETGVGTPIRRQDGPRRAGDVSRCPRPSARAASALLPRDCERRFRRVLHPHVHPASAPCLCRRTRPLAAASCPHGTIQRVSLDLVLNALFQRSVHSIYTPVGGDLPLLQLRNRPSVTSLSNSISCTAPSHGPHRSVSTEPGRCITCNAPHRRYALDRQGMTWGMCAAYSVGPCPRHPGRVIASTAGPSPRSPATFWGTSCTPTSIAFSGP